MARLHPSVIDMDVKSESQPSRRAWWKECAVYQIYPASFQDSNGDGIGDIPGIITKLDYIKSLGVDIVWLGPCYKSPNADMGYDISDYRDIDPQYGTLEDLDRLISGLHEYGLKILMDLVVNHTSDEHEWFQNSRSSKSSPFRDWYVWKPPKYSQDGTRHPPNNWAGHFGGSVWEFDEASQEYYLHLFHKKQPDLNWENPEVRKAVHEIIRFWLDRGVDGFRMDVINFISKDQRFPDSVSQPGKGSHGGAEFYAAGPRLHEYLKEIGTILKEYDAFSVGEMPCVDDKDEILKVVKHDRGELSMIFQFDIVDIDHGPNGKFSKGDFTIVDLKEIVNRWQTFMYDNGGWNALFLENHDQGRTVTRLTKGGDTPEFRTVAAQMLATFMGFQSGTLFVYQGQEIGMKNLPKDWQQYEYKDVEVVNYLRRLSDEDEKAKDPNYIPHEMWLKARDNGRTPVQWNSSPNAGFTAPESTPWMRVNDDYKEWNANIQLNDPCSVFSYWVKVLAARKDHKDIFVYGNFKLIEGTEHPEMKSEGESPEEQVLAYRRTDERTNKFATVLLNFRKNVVRWTPPSGFTVGSRLLLGNYSPALDLGNETLYLRPYEAAVILNE